MPENYKILIADSQFLIVDSLKRLIESELQYLVCGVADNKSSLLDLIKEHSPHLLITDINLIDYNGYDDLLAIKNEYRKLSIMILTGHLTTTEACRIIRSGIKNISLKTSEKDEVLYSIEMALSGRKHLSDDVLDLIVGLNIDDNPGNDQTGLTKAETEIIRMIAGGMTTKEIALKRNISFHTVITHRKNIFRKLDINSVSDLTRYAIRVGLINNDMEFNI